MKRDIASYGRKLNDGRVFNAPDDGDDDDDDDDNDDVAIVAVSQAQYNSLT